MTRDGPIPIDDDGDEPPQVQPQTQRGPGRPKIVRTRERGRPRREFNQVPRPESNVIELNEVGLLSEISMKEVLNGADADEWRDAIVSEMASVLINDTWVVVVVPEDRKPSAVDSSYEIS